MKKERIFALLLAFTVVWSCLLSCGCEWWEALGQADTSAVSSSEPKRVIKSWGLKHGADLEPVNGVGELVEEPEESSGTGSEVEPDPGDDSLPFPWDLSLLPYRAMLSQADQKVYDEIYRKIAGFQSHFSLQNPATVNSIDNIVHAVYYDNPELFWIDAAYRYGYTVQGNVTDLTISFNQLANVADKARQQFEAAANEVIAKAQTLSMAVEKEKYVHDYLVSNTDYQLNSPQNQSAYSALVTRRSVCAGYSRAFQYIMMKMGIPCYYCVGFAGEDHAWNIIKLDDGYYNVDLAWDDPIGSAPGEIHYEYFNLSDEAVGYDHQRQDLSIYLPSCNGSANTYNRVFGGDTPVREGGAPQDYRELGFTDADVLHSVEEYYARSRELLTESGPGEHTMEMVLDGETLRARVFQAVSSRAWFEGFVVPAAENLDLKEYGAEISIKYEKLSNGYVLLSQTVNLKTEPSSST